MWGRWRGNNEVTRIEEEKHTETRLDWIGLKKTWSHHLLNSSTSNEVLLVMMMTKPFVSFLFYFNLHLPIYLNWIGHQEHSEFPNVYYLLELERTWVAPSCFQWVFIIADSLSLLQTPPAPMIWIRTPPLIIIIIRLRYLHILIVLVD